MRRGRERPPDAGVRGQPVQRPPYSAHARVAADTVGMRHAGAFVAAQLDVNQAFPRFLTYDRAKGGQVTARSVAPGFHHLPGHYEPRIAGASRAALTRRDAS